MNHRRLQLPAILAVILAEIAATRSPARAAPYVGVALAEAVQHNGNAAVHADPRALPGGRLFAGIWLGYFSIEGQLGELGVTTFRTGDRTALQYGLFGKLAVPVYDRVDAFVRLGVEYATIGRGNGGLDLHGDGPVVGGGLEYRFATGNAVVPQASVFVDYQWHHSDFHGSADGEISPITVGTLGLGASFRFAAL